MYLSAKSAYVDCKREPAVNVQLPVIVPEVVFAPVVIVLTVRLFVVATVSGPVTVTKDDALLNVKFALPFAEPASLNII